MHSVPENSAENIPAELRALPQWVCWRYEDRDGKRTKAPICAKVNGAVRYAMVNDPTTWTDFDTAVAAALEHVLNGIGFCFAPNDGLTGFDLDHVIDPDTNALKDAYRRAWRIAAINNIIARVTENVPDPPEPPDDLAFRVQAALQGNPALRWDAALLGSDAQ